MDRRCQNCGNVIPANLPYCSVCGYGMMPAKRPSSNVGIILAFVLIGIPSGFCGGCMLLAGGANPAAFLMGLVGLGIAGLLTWALIRSGRPNTPQR